MAPNDSSSIPMVITNSGPGRLLYNLNCLAQDVKRVRPAAVAEVQSPLGYLSGDDKGDPPQPFYVPQDKGHGGPDVFGYTWVDSDDPGGPVCNWIDISATGTAVTLTDDAFSAALPLGFSFPFYDLVYSQLYIGSNGIITFGAGSNARLNAAIPTATAPNALLALWWDDLNPANGGHIYYAQQADRFIVSFVDIRNYAYPSGTGS